MAVGLRERPSVSGIDADRLMKKIAENNHHLRVKAAQLTKGKWDAKASGNRSK
jgi:hypothetical protein